jgi:hypothetical protein
MPPDTITALADLIDAGWTEAELEERFWYLGELPIIYRFEIRIDSVIVCGEGTDR